VSDLRSDPGESRAAILLLLTSLVVALWCRDAVTRAEAALDARERDLVRWQAELDNGLISPPEGRER
jgi:hypothetical protein